MRTGNLLLGERTGTGSQDRLPNKPTSETEPRTTRSKDTDMNKLVKGSIAGAAGIALLLGGAGTFAVWNDTATLSAPNIQAGYLQLDTATAGKWTKDGAEINPTTYKVIPGTTLVYTQTLKVDAVGTGLKARLTHSSLTEAGGLAPFVDSTMQVSQNGTVDADGIIDFTEGTSNIDVKVTVVFPTTVTGEQGQNTSLDLSDVTFTLTQTV
jgi:alternate signal-mediated exported protein